MRRVLLLIFGVVHLDGEIFVMVVGLVNSIFLVVDDSSALLTVIHKSSLLELNEKRLGELAEDGLHHVLFGESPCVDVGVSHIAEFRLLPIDYVVISKESFGLKGVGQVVLLGFDSVVENMRLDDLKSDSDFSSLDEVHLLHLLAFFIDDVGVVGGREIPGHEA